MKFCFLVVCILMCACNHGSGNHEPNKLNAVSPASPSKLTPISKDQMDRDSITLDSLLTKTLNFANHHLNQKDFSGKHYASSDNFYSNYKYGNLFSDTYKHLLVKRVVADVYFDLFLLKKHKLIKVCTDTIMSLSFLDSKLRDVNGDGYRDLLIHWYPGSGCCRRNVYDVYLYQPQSGGFSAKYKFINPTFSPSEKVIRGVEYGYQTALYKYRWNGSKIDTVEFIYPDTVKKKGFLRSVHHSYLSISEGAKPIKAVPKEYLKIEDYDWFEGNY